MSLRSWPRRPPWLALVACISACVGLAAPAHAAARRSLAIEVAPESGWRGQAVAAALAHDLADDRLAPVPPLACAGRCSDAELRSASVELVARFAIIAPPGAARLDYELRALWPGAPHAVRGAIEFGALGAAGTVDRAQLAGVLRDALHRMARAPALASDEPVDAAVALAGPRDVALALAALLAALVLPAVYGALRRRRLVARRALLHTALAVGGPGALAVVLAAVAPADPTQIALAAGGIAWGAFAAVTLPVVFPPLVGIAQVEYDELGRVVISWCGLVAQRAAALAIGYAPAALAVWWFGDAVSDGVRWGFVLPVALLLARQWLRIAIAVAAELLDGALVDPDADAAAWHAAVHAYVVGYLLRNGLTSIDEDLLDRVVFLPGRADEIAVYGGGLIDTRIAIPRRMLELALAPWGRPHDYAAPRVSTLHWMEWNAGLVMATEPRAPVPTRAQRQPSSAVASGEGTASAREPLGEPSTLAGIIEPAVFDPRTGYRPHDDPAWLDWDAGDAHDGTDASDRDFLFGALVLALTRVQRHGDRPSTIAAVLRHARAAPAVARRLGRWLDRREDAIGCDHAAIAGARHHLVQYLAWRAWQRDDLLTPRAYQPVLAAMSRRVLAVLAETPDPPARERAQLVRLAALVRGAAPRSPRARRLALAALIVASTGALGVAVASAIHYHAVYVDRMTPSPEQAHGKD